MTVYTGKFSSGWAELQLEVTRSSYSIAKNTSTLECVLKIKKLANASSYNLSGGANIYMTINGSKLYSSNTFDIRSMNVGSVKTLATEDLVVTHNNDGTKSVTCKAYFNSGTGVQLGTASISDTYTCGTIPRASSLSLNTTSVNVGSTITASITRNSTSFVHDVEFFVSGWGGGSTEGINKGYYKKYTKVTTSQSYTIPTAWYNYMPESTSCTAYCRITTRDSSGNKIGSSVDVSFTAKVPASIVPSVGPITFNPWNIVTEDGIERNILVQSKNKFTLSVTDCSGGTGSTVKSYTFSGPGLTTTTQTSKSKDGGTVSTTGSLTYTVTVTDKRGRTASKSISGSSNNAYCYAYSKPSLNSFSAYRVIRNSDGTYKQNANGDYVEYKFTPSFSTVNGTNKYTVTRYCTGAEDSEVTITARTNSTSTETFTGRFKLVDTTKTHKIYLKIQDNYGGTATSTTINILSDSKILNISKKGNSLAIGKMVEREDAFECAWNSRFYKDIYLNKNGAYVYGVLSDGSSTASLLRLSTLDNVTVGSATAAKKTYVLGGVDKIVNIGSSDYKSNLYVTGAASGDSGFSTSSDRRMKKNIENCDLDIVDKLQPITYQLLDSGDNKTHYGFVAQDVVQVLSDVGIDPETCGIIGTIQNGEEEHYVLTYTEFVPLLVTKCQNLQSELDELRQEIAEIKKLIK